MKRKLPKLSLREQLRRVEERNAILGHDELPEISTGAPPPEEHRPVMEMTPIDERKSI